LAEELLFGRLVQGGHVTITEDEKANKLRFIIEESFAKEDSSLVKG
jgi:hypothetical protein